MSSVHKCIVRQVLPNVRKLSVEYAAPLTRGKAHRIALSVQDALVRKLEYHEIFSNVAIRVSKNGSHFKATTAIKMAVKGVRVLRGKSIEFSGRILKKAGNAAEITSSWGLALYRSLVR